MNQQWIKCNQTDLNELKMDTIHYHGFQWIKNQNRYNPIQLKWIQHENNWIKWMS